MKQNLLIAALLLVAAGAFAQGTIAFNNRQTTAGTGGGAQVIAPIFGVDPNDNNPKQGNPTALWNGSNGPTPVPLGTQTYGGTPLNGTGFTATLWAANSTKADDQLAQIATTTFRTSATASLQGFMTSVVGVVPDVPSDPTQFGKFQMRVWDNRGGTITTWAQVLADNSIARGLSTIFTVQFQLGGGSVAAPSLLGLQSFQLFTVVPEPSVIALGALGAGCLLLLRRRK